MDEPWKHISENGRRLKELQREELETLVLEMCDEYDMRNIRLLNLRVSIDKLQTCLEVAEENSRKAVLGFVIAPESQITKPTVKSPKHKEFTAPVYGAFNSYQAGNKRIVTLRHQVETLLTRIQNTMNETQRLLHKKDKYKKLLEERKVPESEPFNHHVVPVKKKPQINNITFGKAVKCTKDLINKENDPQIHNLLTTVYCLLTNNNIEALQAYSEIAFPVLTEMSITELREQLSDRNAQISILNEQYKDFQRRHGRLVDDFTSLNEKMRDHIIEDDTEKNNILAQIEELEQILRQIPEKQKEITELTEEREKLYDAIEQVHAEGMKTIDFEVENKSKIQEMEKEKISLDFTYKALLQENGDKKQSEEDIRTQNKRVLDELNEMLTTKTEVTAQKTVINDKFNLLLKVNIEDPITLAQVAEFCKAITVSEIEERHKAAVDEQAEVKKEVHELKDECKLLKRKHGVLSRAVSDYKKKIAEEDAKIAKLKENQNEKLHVQVFEPESSKNSTMQQTDELKNSGKATNASEKDNEDSNPPEKDTKEDEKESSSSKDKKPEAKNKKSSDSEKLNEKESKKAKESEKEQKTSDKEKSSDKEEKEKSNKEEEKPKNTESQLRKSGTIHSDFESVDSDENIVISATQTLDPPGNASNSNSPVPDEIADSEDEVMQSEEIKEKSDSSDNDF
ncbi:hypothetical protein TVAG_053710 [Trichomonas vaginalis G3]|uniref:Uncharacterized protein n=1 Tax=Trichomonas vaginalis (strain ATCC PRA-98 / G3) TaxID=412133 RepID=A2FGV2_TRIV3|nr:hypothetical protein TVAGG3_0972300 [Trichomonas vaginalis G3]EAX95856.1 hypothetical protein TVAG_053710 [Trichomonas vaginalis G3]KAI5488674.1 hypothetical protein TVAGG3_0972300 [Trichomonas vaginalis G3]|eukprot:XP_001308786.1 hypothetical protein [Trichomonas vaginalis G3]